MAAPAASGGFRAALLDMDGTLVDTEPLWQRAEVATMDGYGAPWDESDMRHCHGRDERTVSRYMAAGVVAAGHPRPDPSVIADTLLGHMQRMIRADRATVKPGVRRLLSSLRRDGVPTALVSSSRRALIEAALDDLGREWFAATVAGDEVPANKPDPLPYQLAAAALGVDPAWCVAIEDSPSGVAAATAAGAFVVVIDPRRTGVTGPRSRAERSLQGVTVQDLNTWFAPPQQAV